MTGTDSSPIDGAGLLGHHAGAVTRFGAFVIDIVAIWVLFSIGGTVLEYTLSVVLGHQVRLQDAAVVSKVALAAWAFVYFAYPLTASGSTFGMAVLGIRAVRLDGTDLDWRHAVVRVLALPLSFLLFCFGFLLILLRRDRRALHDLIARTAVVYAWNAHTTRVKFLSGR